MLNILEYKFDGKHETEKSMGRISFNKQNNAITLNFFNDCILRSYHKKRHLYHDADILFNYFYLFMQGCHTLWELREFKETQGIFKLQKISGKLRETQGILI